MKRAGRQTLVILGAPGGGKGTISNKMLKDFNIHHVSTGDLLRQHVRDQTTIGLQVKGLMESGGLVPENLMLEMIDKEFNGLNADKGNEAALAAVLLDGFPRTLLQAQELHRRFNVNAVISLDIPHQTVIDRISNRYIHPASGRTYSQDYNPEKQRGFDDITGEPLIQRDDDKPASVRKRLELYDQMKEPLLKFFVADAKGVLVRRFAGTESNLIYPEVKKFLLNDVGLPVLQQITKNQTQTLSKL